MDWRQILTIPGRGLVSLEFGEEGTFSPILWRVAKWSPAIIVGVWLYLLWLLLKFRAGIKPTLQSLGVLEIAAVTWVLAAWLAITTYPGQPDYRYVPLLPGLAILSSFFYSRALSPATRAVPSSESGGVGPFFSFCLWAVLLLPLLLALKPWTTQFIMAVGRNVPLGDRPGIAYSSAGAIFMALWLFLLLALAGFRRKAEQLSTLVLARFTPLLFGLLLLFQCWIIGSYFASVETTLVDRQAELVHYVNHGDIVTGRWAGTLFLPLHVQTIRRISPDSSPLETFDNPLSLDRGGTRGTRIAVIARQVNFRPYKPYEPMVGELIEAGYESIHRFPVGPTHGGNPRFEFELWRRSPPKSPDR